MDGRRRVVSIKGLSEDCPGGSSDVCGDVMDGCHGAIVIRGVHPSRQWFKALQHTSFAPGAECIPESTCAPDLDARNRASRGVRGGKYI